MDSTQRSPKVKDPLGHIKLAVSDFAKSASFYKQLFLKLSYAQVCDKPTIAGWVTPEGFGIWISQAEVDTPPLKHGATGFHHLCMKAESAQQVDELHAESANTATVKVPKVE